MKKVFQYVNLVVFGLCVGSNVMQIFIPELKFLFALLLWIYWMRDEDYKFRYLFGYLLVGVILEVAFKTLAKDLHFSSDLSLCIFISSYILIASTIRAMAYTYFQKQSYTRRDRLMD